MNIFIFFSLLATENLQKSLLFQNFNFNFRFFGKNFASEKKGEVNILNNKPMTPVVQTCGCLANSCGFKSLIGPGRWLYLLDPPCYSSRGPTSHCMWSPRDPCCPHYNHCFSQDFFLCSLSGNCPEEDGEKVGDLPEEDIEKVTIIPRKIQLNLSINKYKA